MDRTRIGWLRACAPLLAGCPLLLMQIPAMELYKTAGFTRLALGTVFQWLWFLCAGGGLLLLGLSLYHLVCRLRAGPGPGRKRLSAVVCVLIGAGVLFGVGDALAYQDGGLYSATVTAKGSDRTGAYVVMETQLGGSAWSIELRCPAACYNLLEVGRVYGPVYYVGKGENGPKYLTDICPKPEGTES